MMMMEEMWKKWSFALEQLNCAARTHHALCADALPCWKDSIHGVFDISQHFTDLSLLSYL